MHYYDTSFDEILETLKLSVGKKNTNKPTNDHSMTQLSTKSKSGKSTNAQQPRSSIFQKLYSQRIVLKNKKMKLEYETKRSREEDEKQYCTFSPNIRSRISTTPPPCNDDSFYLKNLEWQERRNKDIKRQQCERNQEKLKELTLTPRIVFNMVNQNDKRHRSPNQKENAIAKKSGVVSFLNRQKKARMEKDYVSFRKAVPNSHTWNIKKGMFSQIK